MQLNPDLPQREWKTIKAKIFNRNNQLRRKVNKKLCHYRNNDQCFVILCSGQDQLLSSQNFLIAELFRVSDYIIVRSTMTTFISAAAGHFIYVGAIRLILFEGRIEVTCCGWCQSTFGFLPKCAQIPLYCTIFNSEEN